MGIVNVTPDSFSDGGKWLDPAAAIDHALALVADGADLLDVGGESTRPHSEPVSEAEELRRTASVVAAICEQTSVPVSIDTSKSVVASEAIAAGAEIVNDVTACTGDAAMTGLVVETGVGVCIMHMRGTPQTMQDDPRYDDATAEVRDYLAGRIAALTDAGVARDCICVDPGLGFGKTHDHNLTLLREVAEFHTLGAPILIGHSRKGFIAHVLGDKERDRTAGTIGVSLAMAAASVQVLRVHDVAATRDALLLFEAAGGLDARSR